VPDTFEAFAVLALIVLPGAVFVYAIERQTGAWGIKAGDRVMRFVVLSALALVIAVPYAYVLWRQYIKSGELAAGGPFPWRPYLVAVGYLVLLPAVAGTLAGRGIRRGHRWSRIFGRQGGAPRAFDYLFGGNPNGYVRILLQVDPPTWVAGAFTTENHRGGGRHAYAASYPENPDIFLPVALECDPVTGAFRTDSDGNAVPTGGSLLVDGGRIVYLEFIG
jgi:hypothetical protein